MSVVDDLRTARSRGERPAAPWANLRGADLCGADLCLQVTGLPSGQAVLYPTRDGWALIVGCWTGTPDTLRTLIAGETGWPEASATQRIERRPGLGLLADLCDDHIKRQPGVIEDLAQRWPADEKSEAKA